MRAMTKRERVLAAVARRAVDRPPVAFWRHAPDVDHTAEGLAEAMLAFHRRWDLDLIKVMSSGVYCVEDWGCEVAYTGAVNGAKQCTRHAVQKRADWARIKTLDAGAGALGRELEAVRLIVRGRVDDAPVLHTLFSPLTIARQLAGDRVASDLRDEPDAVTPAVEAIGESVARQFSVALVGGLNQQQTLRKGTPAAIATETADAIAQTDGVGLIVGPGCVLPLDAPDANLEAVVKTVKDHRAS